jgi:Flp pilus assembly protein TadG
MLSKRRGRGPASLDLGARRLWNDRRGVTAVEFALVALPFLTLIFGIAEAGLDAFASNALDLTTEKAARVLMTGSDPTIATAQAFLNQNVCPQLPFFMSCSRVTIQLRTVGSTPSPTFYTVSSGAGGSIPALPPGTTGKWCPGAPGDIELLEFAYAMPVITQGLLGHTVVLGDGTTARPLESRATYMNEPFANRGSACS